MSYLTQAYGFAKLAIQANGPTIMVVSGVVSMGVGAVIGAKKTLQVEEVIEKHTPYLDKIAYGQELELENYTDKDALADRLKVYTRAGIDLGVLYAVPAVFFFGGVALVFGGHRIMVQRNATLAIAFTGLKKTFDAYRGRVTEEFGADVDQAMYGGYKLTEFVDAETGEKKYVNSRDWEASDGDPYNRIFEQGASSMWQNDLGVNKMFVAQQQRFAQERLSWRGFLYLSEVYEALGFPESDISRVVGWKVTRNPDGSKNYPIVDFGLDKPMPDDWKYNGEKAIYLDFNCQGLIVGGKVQKILEKS